MSEEYKEVMKLIDKIAQGQTLPKASQASPLSWEEAESSEPHLLPENKPSQRAKTSYGNRNNKEASNPHQKIASIYENGTRELKGAVADKTKAQQNFMGRSSSMHKLVLQSPESELEIEQAEALQPTTA
eukprot:TRINITY_DN7143_c0_g2_i1.p2 TRINITY_DN7143_c0_g2~~TRINITY_DN7143_c0_g2_i1.p2  ORF type:complete len:129 (-),score=18.61 TRINITY_DN7143_c0_g2_i1:14-400(-)